MFKIRLPPKGGFRINATVAVPVNMYNRIPVRRNRDAVEAE